MFIMQKYFYFLLYRKIERKATFDFKASLKRPEELLWAKYIFGIKVCFHANFKVLPRPLHLQMIVWQTIWYYEARIIT